MISYEAILAVMERRFDHVSARVVLGEALKAAGLAANQKRYSPDEVRSLAGAVAAVGSRVEAVTAALNDLAGAETTPAPAHEVVTEPPPSHEDEPPAPHDEEPPAEASDDTAAPKKKKKK